MGLPPPRSRGKMCRMKRATPKIADRASSLSPNGRLLQLPAVAFLLATVALFATGCAETSNRQVEILYAAQRAYDAGDYAGSVRQTTDFVATPASRKDLCRAYYVRGVANARLGKRSSAYADLQQVTSLNADDDAVWRAHMQLGVMYFEDDRYPVAVQAFEQALKLMPKHAAMDWVLYRYGQALERVGRWSDARPQFQRVVAEFPSGSVTVNAKRRVALAADHFSIQCGSYSQKANAANAAADLGRAGFSAGVYLEKRSTGDMWVVRIGNYRTYAEAQSALAKVRQRTSDAVIWP